MAAPKLSRKFEAALALANNPRASPKDLLHAAEVLTAHADLDGSDALIGRARQLLAQSKVEAGGFVDRLSAVNRTLRTSLIPRRLKDIGPIAEELASDKGMVLHARPGARRLLVVLATTFNDFWVSLPVLHCLLTENDTAILYLRDFSDRMYAYGIDSIGPDFASVENAVLETAATRGVEVINVMGFSSGGYAGLLLAAKAKARGYLGFSIRTDLSQDSRLPLDRLAMRVASDMNRPEMLLDLKPIVAQGTPGQTVLYYGEKSVIDAAHAEHLRGVPGVILKPVKGGLHNSVMSLLAANEFSRVLKRFLG